MGTVGGLCGCRVVDPQRKARVAASAPWSRLEGRVKGGYLGPRDMKNRKRTKLPNPLSSEDRLIGLKDDAVSRIGFIQAMLKLLLRKRSGSLEQSVLVKVIQLLTPLTALVDGSVRRSDLPIEQALRNANGYIGITTSLWSGRQDLDIIALYKHHRDNISSSYTSYLLHGNEIRAN